MTLDMTRKLYPEKGETWVCAQFYGLCCLAHRLRKFGWEPICQRLDRRQLLILSTMVHEPLASACYREAERLLPMCDTPVG